MKSVQRREKGPADNLESGRKFKMADQYLSEGKNKCRGILFQELNLKSYHLQMYILFR